VQEHLMFASPLFAERMPELRRKWTLALDTAQSGKLSGKRKEQWTDVMLQERKRARGAAPGSGSHAASNGSPQTRARVALEARLEDEQAHASQSVMVLGFAATETALARSRAKAPTLLRAGWLDQTSEREIDEFRQLQMVFLSSCNLRLNVFDSDSWNGLLRFLRPSLAQQSLNYNAIRRGTGRGA
jgi:hypothetical protein